VGRLATYRYYNMDQVVAQALKLYAELSATDDVATETTHGSGNGGLNHQSNGRSSGRSIAHAVARNVGGDRVHGEPSR
jgi:hypothetical protein